MDETVLLGGAIRPSEFSRVVSSGPPFGNLFLQCWRVRTGVASVADIVRHVEAGREQAFTFFDQLDSNGKIIPGAIGLTQVEHDEGPRSLHVLDLVAPGRMDLVPRLLNFAEGLARDWECERILVSGREGWRRVLADYGYNSIPPAPYAPTTARVVREIV